MNFLITGATGFIGQRLTEALRDRAGSIFAATRDPEAVASLWPDRRVTPKYANLDKPETLGGLCTSIDVVFHLAGYAHAENAYDDDNEERHWRITVDGTRLLLSEAARAGVKKFVFASSVKAMGEGGDDCLDETSLVQPASAYGRAKLEAEKLILAVGKKHDMHVCNIRLPLVYGRGNKGNIPRMIRAVDAGLFPPVPEVGNKRSMVDVQDVVQALLLAAEKPRAGGHTYIVTDGHTYSTREIYTMICSALGKPLPRWTIPVSILRFGARIGDLISRLRGRPFVLDSDTLEKLIGSAWYSSEKISQDLGYRPTRTLRDVLPDMIEEYKGERKAANSGRAVHAVSGRE